METILSLLGTAPAGYEVLEYIVKAVILMAFMGLGIGLVSYLMSHLIDMGR